MASVVVRVIEGNEGIGSAFLMVKVYLLPHSAWWRAKKLSMFVLLRIPIERGRNALTVAVIDFADARAFQRFVGEAIAGVFYLAGDVEPQPLLGAVRVRRTDGWLAAVPGESVRRRRRRHRGQP